MMESENQGATVVHWRITDLAIRCLFALTGHYHLHRAEHVGMFAGSLLSRSDWDHS